MIENTVSQNINYQVDKISVEDSAFHKMLESPFVTELTEQEDSQAFSSSIMLGTPKKTTEPTEQTLLTEAKDDEPYTTPKKQTRRKRDAKNIAKEEE